MTHSQNTPATRNNRHLVQQMFQGSDECHCPSTGVPVSTASVWLLIIAKRGKTLM
jgi:hypothetical protein